MIHGGSGGAVVLGNHPPRRCGIATFTADLADAIEHHGRKTYIVAMDDGRGPYDYPERVVHSVEQQDEFAYLRLAERLEKLGMPVFLQHEYGIFGGSFGEMILLTLQNTEVPVISTLHTILRDPSAEQLRILKAIAARSNRLVVMSRRAVDILVDVYDVPRHKIVVIPHGVHDRLNLKREEAKAEFGWQGRKVALTFGLLGPDKGLEYMLEALPSIVEQEPEALYVITGATHPHIRASSGEAYRESLIERAERLGVSGHVEFIDEFVELDKLQRLLTACDVYVTPYLKREQITSGTLAYAVGAGRAVVSTDYWHAEELLANDVGILVPCRCSEALADSVGKLLSDDVFRAGFEERALEEGDGMRWKVIAGDYLTLAEEAELAPCTGQTRLSMATALGKLDLGHLEAMTDDTGLLQHANYDIPNRFEGYCTDDNARALTFVQERMATSGATIRLENLERTYLSFLHHAFNEQTGRFRNFMGYGRNWLEDIGSEESQGRAIAAMGMSSQIATSPERRKFSRSLFDRAIVVAEDFEHARSTANALVGLCAILMGDPDHKAYQGLAFRLAKRLIDAYRENSSLEWRWFEPKMTYDNGKVAEALLRFATIAQDEIALDTGLDMLEWLCEQQRGPQDSFVPIGNNGFYIQQDRRALFAQQPIEAWSTILACGAAYEATKDRRWADEAETAYAWFAGQNVVGLSVVAEEGGGAFDGLAMEGLNENRGAESTLAYLGSTIVIHRLRMGQARPGIRQADWGYRA
jgi:glycosyltransferase involved in cell wall biosynthesis